jgi:gliding motility-associated-like protein
MKTKITAYLMKRILTIFLFLSMVLVFEEYATAQVTASFSASTTTGCTPLTVNFTNGSTSGANILYYWDFGNGQTSTSTNPSTVFNAGGIYNVQLIVTNTSTGESADASVSITTTPTPNAAFTIVDNSLCANEYFVFNYADQPRTSALWTFGDSKSDTRTINPMAHKYSADGSYNVKLILRNGVCADTSTIKTVTVTGPHASFSMSKDKICVGETVTFTLGATTGVTSYNWDLGTGTTVTGSPVQHKFTNYGDIVPILSVNGPGGSCEIKDTLVVFHVEAIIETSGGDFCAQRVADIQNSSFGATQSHWDLGNGQFSDLENPYALYEAGNYNLTLYIQNDYGCKDTARTSVHVNQAPSITLGQGWFVCLGDSATLEASGGDVIEWSPAIGLSDPFSYTPRAAPPSTMNYLAKVTDTTTNCTSSGNIMVTLQKEPDWNSFEVDPLTDTLIVGDIIKISVDSLSDYLYTWETSDPTDTSISCTSCPSIFVQPLNSLSYSVTISDTNHCFTNTFEIPIFVREEFNVGLPDAFRPSSDPSTGNNLLLIRGWGIKNLVEFRIYNRFGVEVFYTTDLNMGWDGTYKGKIQNMDTYQYYFKVDMWNGETREKRGSVNLLR